MLITDKVRLEFLQSLTPSFIVKADLQKELQKLETIYQNEIEEAQYDFVVALREEPEVIAALEYDFSNAMVELKKAMQNTPQQLSIRQCAAMLILLQGWKDFVVRFVKDISRHHAALDSACERGINNWRGKSLARSDWQAKAQAMTSVIHLIRARDLAKAAKSCAILTHESLVSQWATLSRVSTIMTDAAQIGDVDIPNIDLLLNKKHEED